MVARRPPYEKNQNYAERKYFEYLSRSIDTLDDLRNTVTFLTLTNTNLLGAERALTGSGNVSITDAGANSTATLDLTDTAVTPGTYAFATVTADQKGRVTALSDGTATLDATYLRLDTTNDPVTGSLDLNANLGMTNAINQTLTIGPTNNQLTGQAVQPGALGTRQFVFNNERPTVFSNDPAGTYYDSAYAFSIQSSDSTTFMEILNSGGADTGAFFGMDTNEFQIWNWQGNSAGGGPGGYPIRFYGGVGAAELLNLDGDYNESLVEFRAADGLQVTGTTTLGSLNGFLVGLSGTVGVGIANSPITYSSGILSWDFSVANTWTGDQTFGTDTELRFRDTTTRIYSPSTNYMRIDADGQIDLYPSTTAGLRITPMSWNSFIPHLGSTSGFNGTGPFFYLQDNNGSVDSTFYWAHRSYPSSNGLFGAIYQTGTNNMVFSSFGTSPPNVVWQGSQDITFSNTGAFNLDVDSTISNTMLFEDNVQLQFGTDTDGAIWHTGTTLWTFQNTVAASTTRFLTDDGEYSFDDYVFIGTTTPTNLSPSRDNDALSAYKLSANTSGTRRAGLIFNEWSSASANSGSVYGLNAFAYTNSGASGNLTKTNDPGGLCGIRASARHHGEGLVSKAAGISAKAEYNGIGVSTVITDAISFLAEGIDANAGTVTNAYNFYSTNHDDETGTITNAYGLYLEEQTEGSNNYEAFIAGGGGLFFRDANTSLSSSATQQIDVAGSLEASGDIAVTADQRIDFEGLGGDTYIEYNSTDSTLQFYVNGTLAMELDGS